MKRILEIAIYKPGDLTSEVTALGNVNSNVSADRAVYTGSATVRSRFKGRDFSSLYQLTRVYEMQQERWQVVASRTARLGDE